MRGKYMISALLPRKRRMLPPSLVPSILRTMPPPTSRAASRSSKPSSRPAMCPHVSCFLSPTHPLPSPHRHLPFFNLSPPFSTHARSPLLPLLLPLLLCMMQKRV
jgi:hypothetical protein